MILVSALQTAGGLGLLLFGGEVLLRGAVGLAERSGLSKLLIGLTVVAAATSMPELVVVVATGIEGVPDVGVGNVVGSNIANILLILGAGAVLFPIATRPRDCLRDGLAVLFASCLFLLFALLGTMTWPHGVIMLLLLVGYLAFSYRNERNGNRKAAAKADAQTANPTADQTGDRTRADSDAQPDGETATPAKRTGWLAALVFVVIGVATLVLGSELLIRGSVDIARAIGVSEAVIGLTLVAIGTSLPELATAIVAGLRHHTEVALGNVLGSNLFNILAVLPALTFTLPFEVAAEMMAFDIWVMVGVSVLLVPVMLTGWRIGRLEGALFLLLYAGYIGWLFQRIPAAT